MNTAIFRKLRSPRFSLLWSLYVILITISFVTRVVLLAYSSHEVSLQPGAVAGAFLIGFFFDVVNAFYFTLPVVLYLWLVPQRWYTKTVNQWILTFIMFVSVFILLFTSIAEYFFWDEFNSRFNFIAVDYLVYTTEVIGNIRQSYPITWIIIGIGIVAVAITYWVRKLRYGSSVDQLSFRQRTPAVLFLFFLPLASFFLIEGRLHNFSSNQYNNELAGNGMYELFAAYRNNELDYEQFYPHLSDALAATLVKKHFAEPSGSDEIQFSIEHDVTSTEPENKLNVVLISVESFSAEFMKLFGNTHAITPRLDSLARQSLVFTNVYATGTRTVRGLEALSLSVPPTPGQSIVRRPNNENLFSMATVFNEKGYESKFIYGGYGYFDNMNYFFSNNGYNVVDRTALDDEDIDYENIWGVADENLFELSLKEIDKTIAGGKPSFVHIMTTSNHRPYTYPEGRIDIPSHTGRDGAVKYTDYAIGKFIQEASKKSWFSNTVFVIVADHCASSAGKTALPVNKYHIPLIVFSPAHVTSRTNDQLMSQIDVAPTLFGLLNFSYKSKFYGYDILSMTKGNERAFISTYQALGFIEHDSLVILAPKKSPKIELLTVNADLANLNVQHPDKMRIAEEAISWYQLSSYSFRHGLMKNDTREGLSKNRQSGLE